MPVSLPDNPDLERFRRDARALQRAVRSGDPHALSEVGRHHPSGVPASPGAFALSAAQLVVARRCGFASWPRLRHYLASAAPLRRSMPVSEPADGATPDGNADPGERFCALACLTYSPLDGPERWSRASDVLARHPDLTSSSIWAAAAAGDVAALRAQLRATPDLARTEGGPYRWAPLLYLAYSRVAGGDPLAGAQVLLDAGADPNDGYLWRGMPTPFTVLAGAFGGGEQGRQRQPPHRCGTDLARLLLARGADPNDAQALYNRMFDDGDDHLALLAEYGLGSGDGGPWRRRLGEVHDSPAELLRYQLAWAIEHRLADRAAILLRCGADPTAPLPRWPVPHLAGITPVAAATLRGDERMAALLTSRPAHPER